MSFNQIAVTKLTAQMLLMLIPLSPFSAIRFSVTSFDQEMGCRTGGAPFLEQKGSGESVCERISEVNVRL